MRRRLIVAIVAVVTASLVLFGVPLAIVVRRTYRDEELLRLQRDTVAATRLIDLSSGRADPVELPRSSDQLAVYDLAGRQVAGHGPRAGDALVLRALRSGKAAQAQQGGRLVTAVPLVAHERVTGAVRAARSAAALTARANRTSLELLALAAAVLSLALVAARLAARRLAIPLERLARSARRLGDGDFAVRTARSGVPELDAVARALDATAHRLGDLVARERAFSADASHQLRTPLAALRLELEAMELGREADPELDGALRQVQRLQSTIETLLSVARDAPRGQHVADLRGALEEMRIEWTGPLAAQARPLRISIDGEAGVARAAAPVVREILEVLVGNAAQHGAGAVTVTLRDAVGFLAIDVSDEGPGLEAPTEAAFARRSESATGHGIGLALARSLAHADGGRLTVSGPGPGPTFTLLLPRAEDGSGSDGPARVAAAPA